MLLLLDEVMGYLCVDVKGPGDRKPERSVCVPKVGVSVVGEEVAKQGIPVAAAEQCV